MYFSYINTVYVKILKNVIVSVDMLANNLYYSSLAETSCLHVCLVLTERET